MTIDQTKLTMLDIINLLKSGWSVHRTMIRGDALLYLNGQYKPITSNQFIELNYQNILTFVDDINGWHPIFHGRVLVYTLNQDSLAKVDYSELTKQSAIDLLKSGYKLHKPFSNESALLTTKENEEKYLFVSESVVDELRSHIVNTGLISYGKHPIFSGDDVYVYEIKQEGEVNE